jgi:hypothetical protein
LVLPLVALTIFVVWFLYFRRQTESAIPAPLRILLAVTRGLVILITGLLIISPWIRTSVTRKNLPWFIIARDNSVSVPPPGDSSGIIRNSEVLQDRLRKSLEGRFQVKEVLFGAAAVDGGKISYSDEITDPGDLFKYLKLFSRTHDIGGLLLASDGIATRGISFGEAASDFPSPVSVLASGDSARYPDVRIQDVVTNERVRRNSAFPVRVYFNTSGYSSGGLKVQISGSNGIIAEQVIPNPQTAPPFADFSLQSAERGTMQLTAIIVPDEPDRNQDNNSRRFSVKVSAEEGEVLILFEAPHPDINAAAEALKEASVLNVTLMNAADYAGTEKDFDLVVFHGLPSLKHPMGLLMQLVTEKQWPALFILTGTTEPALLNREGHGMTIGEKRRKGEAARGLMNPVFNLFSLPPDFSAHLANWPPLDLAFETYSADPGSQAVMFQKILSVELNDPLVVFASSRGVKFGYICGEGIWLWRMHEYYEQRSSLYFDEWFSKMVQYLMTDEKQDRFRIVVPDELFAYSTIRINAHLLNKTMEEVNEPDVNFTITDSAGGRTEFPMGRVNDFYELNINGFAPGNYRYSATANFGGESFTREGDLAMQTRQVEQRYPPADYRGLRLIASKTGGTFFSPGDEDRLVDDLEKLKPAAEKVRQEFKWFDLINLKWLLPMLFLLLAMEWFLRRWFGIR